MQNKVNKNVSLNNRLRFFDIIHRLPQSLIKNTKPSDLMNYNEWCGRFHCCWIFLQRFFFLKAWWVISESACKKIYVEIQGNDVSCFLHLCNVSTCNWVNKLVFVNCIHQVFILTFNFESSFIEMTFWTANSKVFFSLVSNSYTQRVRPTGKVHYACMLPRLKWQTNQ